MLTNDFIVEQSRMVIRFLKTMLDSPEGGLIDNLETIRFSGNLLETQKNICGMLDNHEFNKAENAIFDLLEISKADSYICMALWFYNRMLDYDEDTLENNDYEKEEILEGLKELEAIKLN